MQNRTGSDTVTVVVACDDDVPRGCVAAALSGARDMVVPAAVSTGTMTTTVFRLRPDVLVLSTPRLRHVDVARLRAIGRDRRAAPPVVVLLVDDPDEGAEPAARAGVAAVWPTATDLAGLPDAVRTLLDRVRPDRSGSGRRAPSPRPGAVVVSLATVTGGSPATAGRCLPR